MTVSIPRTLDDPITRELIGKSEFPKMELFKLNTLYVLAMLSIQAIVTSTGIILAKVTATNNANGSFNLFKSIVFDTRSAKFGIAVGIGLYVLGTLLDQLGDWLEQFPIGAFLRKMNTGSMDFSLFLFLLGRQAPATVSTLIAIVLSISSSIAEEVFFRGFLLKFLESITGSFSFSVIVSSISFGLTL